MLHTTLRENSLLAICLMTQNSAIRGDTSLPSPEVSTPNAMPYFLTSCCARKHGSS